MGGNSLLESNGMVKDALFSENITFKRLDSFTRLTTQCMFGILAFFTYNVLQLISHKCNVHETTCLNYRKSGF